MTQFLRCGALLLATLPALAVEAPPPPVLTEAVPAAAQPASAAASAAEPRRRRVAGPEDSTHIRVSEDQLVRVEEHLNKRNQVVKVIVYPKDGSRPYEMDPPKLLDERQKLGPSRWQIRSF